MCTKFKNKYLLPTANVNAKEGKGTKRRREGYITAYMRYEERGKSA